MSESIISCPRCNSNSVIKNGFLRNGNQNFKCKDCGKQFVIEPKNKVIEQETKNLIDKLLLEKLPLTDIAITTGVSEQWLESYINSKYTESHQVQPVIETAIVKSAMNTNNTNHTLKNKTNNTRRLVGKAVNKVAF